MQIFELAGDAASVKVTHYSTITEHEVKMIRQCKMIQNGLQGSLRPHYFKSLGKLAYNSLGVFALKICMKEDWNG